jgi:hypothetical protein
MQHPYQTCSLGRQRAWRLMPIAELSCPPGTGDVSLPRASATPRLGMLSTSPWGLGCPAASLARGSHILSPVFQSMTGACIGSAMLQAAAARHGNKSLHPNGTVMQHYRRQGFAHYYNMKCPQA